MQLDTGTATIVISGVVAVANAISALANNRKFDTLKKLFSDELTLIKERLAKVETIVGMGSARPSVRKRRK